MKYKHFKILLFLASTIFLFAQPKQTLANIPDVVGHVYYANPDGNRTTRGVANIWVRWTDTEEPSKFPKNSSRYAKTDSNGMFVFKMLIDYTKNATGEGDIDAWRPEYDRQRFTWIKPDDPDAPPIQDANSDYTSQGYARMYGSNEEASFGCTKNPHTFTVVQPKNWHGRFVDAQTLDSRGHVVNASTLGGYDLNNGTSGNVTAGDFYYLPSIITGQVVDEDNNPVAGVTVNIYNARVPQQSRPAVTDRDGRFQLSEFIGKDEIYAVRIDNPPLGFAPKTTTNGWTWRFVNPLDKKDPRNGNTSLDSSSYEVQKYGDDDCAGPALSGPEAGKRGRCNFKLEILPQTTPPAPNPTGPTSSPSSPPVTSSPIPSLPPGLDDVTIQCSIKPIEEGSTVVGVTVDRKPVDLNSATPLSLTLNGFPGQSVFPIPVVINYSNGACRVKTLSIGYVSSLSASPTPDPTLCLLNTGRPDGCTCTASSQCQGGKCDVSRGNKCFADPFIRTEGGDVHSNIKITQ